MKLIGVISTAVLSLTLGVAAPVYAQQEEEKSKPSQQEEKKTQLDESARQAEKGAPRQDKNAKQEEKSAQQQDKNAGRKRETHSNTHSRLSLNGRSSAPVVTVVAAFPTTVSAPILDRNTSFVSAKATTGITASNTVAIRSDSLTHGQATGSIRKTFLWSRLTACITCATRCILALTLRSASHSSGVGCGLEAHAT